ncbi:hypothetical protein ACHAW5_007122 [Stephanodiscus triporus]|uniref:Prenyltransferase alpha-alpha toroid domain-containing protein n=1 Tax=Stephanodiscus triporus TaxID=2934178 RepID=A0ABD3NXD8_9STRA
MTYVALCTLLALGDDLSRVDRGGIMRTLRRLQREDGSFSSVSSSSSRIGTGRRRDGAGGGVEEEEEEECDDDDDDDSDLRFVYTAAAIRHLLLVTAAAADDHDDDDDDHLDRDGPSTEEANDEYDDIDVSSATSYVLSCRSYDGALGLVPGGEGHGGSTFCGIAALRLLGTLDDALLDGSSSSSSSSSSYAGGETGGGWREDLVRWCVSRQRSVLPPPGKTTTTTTTTTTVANDDDAPVVAPAASAGMQGRPNKPEDTCYSYWIGGTLSLLSESDLIDRRALREYVMSCQGPSGGFGKVEGATPDLLHSFYSLAWLALSDERGLCDANDTSGGDDDDGDDEGHRSKLIRTLSELDCALGVCSKRVGRRAIG